MEVNNLAVGYGNDIQDKKVTFTVQQGECVALCGENGCCLPIPLVIVFEMNIRIVWNTDD